MQGDHRFFWKFIAEQPSTKYNSLLVTRRTYPIIYIHFGVTQINCIVALRIF